MSTVTFSQIPKWNAEVASDLFQPLIASAGEWEANYLLPQLIGPTERPTYVTEQSTSPRVRVLVLWRMLRDKAHPTNPWPHAKLTQ